MPTKYADSSSETQIQAKTVISRIIAHRKGKENAIPASQLAEAVVIGESAIYDLIPEIRREFRLPVGSCNKGYYTIQTEAEYQEHIERFEQNIKTARQNKRDLKAAFNE